MPRRPRRTAPAECGRTGTLLATTLLTMAAIGGCAPRGSLPERDARPPRVTPPAERRPPAAAVEAIVELSPGATLDEYRLHAIEHNPGIAALYREWRAQSERVRQALSIPEPRLTYTEYLRSVETRTGPQERSISIMQPIPWFTRPFLASAAEAKAAHAAWQHLLAAQLALDHDVRSTYADLYFLGRSLAVTRENLELLGRLERVARQKLRAGGESHRDVVRLQVEIGRLEDRVRALLDMRVALAARFNSLLNRPPDAPLEVPESLPAEAAAPEASELRLLLAERNPELAALRHEIERADVGIELAETEYYPEFMVGFATIFTDEAVMAGVSGSGEDPWLFSVGVDLPLWFWKYRAGEREARARRQSAQHRFDDRTNRLSAELELAVYNLKDAVRRVALYETTLIPKAREALTVTEAAFRADTADFLDLIDAERVLLEFQLARERALADELRARAALDRLLGRSILEVPRTGMEESP